MNRNCLILEGKRRNQARKKTIMLLNELGVKDAESQEKFIYDEFFCGHGDAWADNAIIRLEPMVARIYVSEHNMFVLRKLKKLIECINYINVANGVDISKIPLDCTYAQLKDMFEPYVRDLQNSNKDIEYTGKSDYDVVCVGDDFEKARYYGQFTGKNGGGMICYTEELDIWEKYQKGQNSLYILLKSGWESITIDNTNIEKAPYDNYGLSMIFLFIAPDGSIETSNSRWNHLHEENLPVGRSVDRAFTENFISQLLQKDFNSVFQPLEDTIGKATIIENNKCQYNILSPDGELVSNVWFDWCEKSENKDLFIVGIEDKYNIITSDGRLVSDVWFDAVIDCYDNCTIVQNGFRFNILRDDYKLVSKNWFYNCVGGTGKWIKVESDEGTNFVSTKGEILSSEWFDHCEMFHNGFASVEKDGKYNFISENGTLLLDTWVDFCGEFSNGGIAKITYNGKCNFITSQGSIVSDVWFDNCSNFQHSGFDRKKVANISINKKHNLIDEKGNILCKEWFDWIWEFVFEFAIVNKDGKSNFINSEGQLISNQWFDKCVNFKRNGFGGVYINNKLYLIDKQGRIFD